MPHLKPEELPSTDFLVWAQNEDGSLAFVKPYRTKLGAKRAYGRIPSMPQEPRFRTYGWTTIDPRNRLWGLVL